MVRNGSNPVAQVAKRWSESENAENLKEVETFVLSLRQKDSCMNLINSSQLKQRVFM